jgi:ATP-dependent Clp protease adaptor protein ClpS
MPNEKSKPTVLDQPKTDTRTPPPYKVILHNDEVNDMEYVIEKIVELTPLSADEAVAKMMEAHLTGCSVLLVCHKERAELYQDQFHSCRLTVTIEPD